MPSLGDLMPRKTPRGSFMLRGPGVVAIPPRHILQAQGLHLSPAESCRMIEGYQSGPPTPCKFRASHVAT